MAEADALREWALAPAPAAAPPASTEQLARHLEFMAAALPSRAQDSESGRKRVAVYASILAGHSNEALAFMARAACSRCEWFPTPKQCLELLAEYQPPPDERALALIECDRFADAAFERWIDNVRGGQPVGDAPERWQRIAVERGVMRRLEGGQIVSRALYHGPNPAPRL